MSYAKLRLQDVCLTIEKTRILNNVNIEFKNNLIYALIGKSGSGKTSLLNIINFLYIPTRGKVIYDGNEIDVKNEDEIAKLRSTEITYFQQELSFIEGITVLDNYKCFCTIRSIPFNKEFIESLAHELGIYTLLNQNVSVLSGGERQRAAFMKLLFLPSSLVLIDEPTNNLDTENTEVILDMIIRLKEQGKTIIVVSHSEDIERISDVCLRMEALNEK